jgi:hypothetical protein
LLRRVVYVIQLRTRIMWKRKNKACRTIARVFRDYLIRVEHQRKEEELHRQQEEEERLRREEERFRREEEERKRLEEEERKKKLKAERRNKRIQRRREEEQRIREETAALTQKKNVKDREKLEEEGKQQQQSGGSESFTRQLPQEIEDLQQSRDDDLPSGSAAIPEERDGETSRTTAITIESQEAEIDAHVMERDAQEKDPAVVALGMKEEGEKESDDESDDDDISVRRDLPSVRTKRNAWAIEDEDAIVAHERTPKKRDRYTCHPGEDRVLFEIISFSPDEDESEELNYFSDSYGVDDEVLESAEKREKTLLDVQRRREHLRSASQSDIRQEERDDDVHTSEPTTTLNGRRAISALEHRGWSRKVRFEEDEETSNPLSAKGNDLVKKGGKVSSIQSEETRSMVGPSLVMRSSAKREKKEELKQGEDDASAKRGGVYDIDVVDESDRIVREMMRGMEFPIVIDREQEREKERQKDESRKEEMERLRQLDSSVEEIRQMLARPRSNPLYETQQHPSYALPDHILSSRGVLGRIFSPEDVEIGRREVELRHASPPVHKVTEERTSWVQHVDLHVQEDDENDVDGIWKFRRVGPGELFMRNVPNLVSAGGSSLSSYRRRVFVSPSSIPSRMSMPVDILHGDGSYDADSKTLPSVRHRPQSAAPPRSGRDIKGRYTPETPRVHSVSPSEMRRRRPLRDGFGDEKASIKVVDYYNEDDDDDFGEVDIDVDEEDMDVDVDVDMDGFDEADDFIKPGRGSEKTRDRLSIRPQSAVTRTQRDAGFRSQSPQSLRHRVLGKNTHTKTERTRPISARVTRTTKSEWEQR